MKRLRGRAFQETGRALAAIALLVASCSTSKEGEGDTGWILAGPAGFSPGRVEEVALAMSLDVPVVAYTDWDTRLPAVMQLLHGSWQPWGSNAVTEGEVVDISLAFSPSNTPYLAFVGAVSGGATTGRATVARCFGGTWSTVGSPGFSAWVSTYTLSVAVAPAGTPYVVYSDGASDGRATVMRFAGDAWQTVGAAGLSAGAVSGTALAIDPAGTPYVAYSDAASGGGVTVMRYAGGAWQTVGAAGFSAGAAYPRLAIDSAGTPYVAYAVDAKITVMRYAGGAWEAVGAPGFGTGALGIRMGSLALDAAGTPFVAYWDPTVNGVTVMKHAGGWQPVGKPGFTQGGGFLSLAIDSAGTPYVAFRDEDASTPAYGKVTVMRAR